MHRGALVNVSLGVNTYDSANLSAANKSAIEDAIDSALGYVDVKPDGTIVTPAGSSTGAAPLMGEAASSVIPCVVLAVMILSAVVILVLAARRKA